MNENTQPQDSQPQKSRTPNARTPKIRIPQDQPSKVRLRRLNIRLSDQEWDKVHRLAAHTTCRSVSDYARKVLSEKPVKVFYRNQSFDEFEERMISLLPILASFGDNFDRLVKEISARQNVPAINAALPIALACATDFKGTAEEIRKHVIKLSDQCDPK